MDILNFLNELALLYPMEQKEPEKVKSILDIYTAHIMQEISNTGKKYDFHKIARYIQRNYKYKNFPSIPTLLQYLPVGVVIDESYSGDEGKSFNRRCRGYDYAFVIVPNHWEKVKTLKELEKSIKKRQARYVESTQ